ncbi:MAG: IS3 family transposase [Lactobacillus sp.]|jgi:transposase InsO family protein/transposase-like protein|nr:IS3 family transposase [Lactobacillus sp.]MCH4068159.1 IS3 family transposase [Lactobacillus sp.]MCI1304340.1 IS3 family transposase [Lactobacillus sp.]MCI1330090.1 IS3 family transposase [Lactobacillus sp.]MCI1360025.1 IS3 family transposase [Lactobacillus sp.]
MSKLSKQDKIDIYNNWKHLGHPAKQLARKYGVQPSSITYLLTLIDRYGTEVLDHSYTTYSVEFKQQAINRVLFNHEIAKQVSLDLALPNSGMIFNWIRKYKEDGYNVINHKKGRPTHEGQRQTDPRTSEASKRPQTAELKAYCRDRIYKKIRCLSLTKKQKPTAQEVASAVTQLRQELHVTVKFVLDAINSNPDLPHLSHSDYYYTLNKHDKDLKNQRLMERIREIFDEHKQRYGYRRITAQLHREGVVVNHKCVKRLMTKMHLFAIAIRRKFKYSSYLGTVGKIKHNLIRRHFKAILPDRQWYSDITEFHLINGQKLYLSPIMDGCTQEIIAYTLSRHPVLKQVMDMLDLAYQKHPALNGLIFHTDQGWQYQHAAFQAWLKDHGISQSMSRKGNSLDAGLMEGFFGILKREMFYGFEQNFTTVEELEQAIKDYIQYYNHDRIKTVLKNHTPIEYRNMVLKAAAQ